MAKFLEIQAISLNFLSNCVCAALNRVPRLVAWGFLRFISFENILFENNQCVNQLIRIELFVLLFKSHAGFYTTLVTARKLCLATLNSDEKIKATLTLFNNYRKNLVIDSCILTTFFPIKGVVSETKTVVLCQWEIETKKLVWKQLFLRVELALKKITTLRICVLALWAQLFQSRLT